MKFSKSSIWITLSSIAVGLLCGYLNISFLEPIAQTIATLFQKGLKLLSLPLIFFAILSSFSSMSNLHETKKIGLKLLGYTLLTTLFSALLALFLFLLISPAPIVAKADAIPSSQNFLSHLIQSFPDNIITPFIEGNVLGICFIALIMGFSILIMPEKQKKTLNHFISSVFQIFLTITKGILFLLPLAMWAFSFLLISQWTQSSQMTYLFWYVVTILLANIIQGFVVLPLFAKSKGLDPSSLAKGSMPALLCAFFTKSSNGTLPLTLHCAKTNLQVKEKTAQFSLPLCSVINMNGCAAFILITVLFVAKSYGVIFSFPTMLLWVFIATLTAIGNAGVPMGCFFLSGALLMGMDIPLDMMGLILPFYAILDMFETSLNVWSDLCVTCAVQKDLDNKIVEELSI